MTFPSNNKHNNYFNLPHILLNKIISYLDDNLDRITFTLVCRDLYYASDKYLSFKLEKDVFIDQNLKYIKSKKRFMNHYRSSYESSLLYKKEIVSAYLYYNTKSTQSYDYSIELKSNEIIKIQNEVNNLIIYHDVIAQFGFNFIAELIEANTNIISLDISLTVGVKVGRIPSQIKRLTISCYSLDEFDLIQFEEGLVYLEIKKNQQSIPAGKWEQPTPVKYYIEAKLPNTLQTLNIKHFKYYIDWDSLPTQLNKIYLSNGLTRIPILPLPDTPVTLSISQQFLSSAYGLTSIQLPTEYISLLKSMQTITTIRMEVEYGTPQITASDFPPSVTCLDFSQNHYYIPHGFIPTSVKHLDLGWCFYDFFLPKVTINGKISATPTSSYFFTSTPYQFEYLHLGHDKTVYNLRMSFDFESVDITRLLPRSGSLQTLALLSDAKLPSGFIPPSVKYLEMINSLDNRNFERKLELNELPPGIEHLKLFHFRYDQISAQATPTSVQSITFKNLYTSKTIRYDIINTIPIWVKSIHFDDKFFYRRIDESYFIEIKKFSLKKTVNIKIKQFKNNKKFKSFFV